MKKIFPLLFILSVCVSGFSQESVSFDQRLSAVFQDSYLIKAQQTDQQHIQYLEFCLDNGYSFIEDFPYDKISTLPELYRLNLQTKKVVTESLSDIDPASFNIFEYSFERGKSSKTYYRIGETGRVICFDSVDELTKKYNDQFHKPTQQ